MTFTLGLKSTRLNPFPFVLTWIAFAPLDAAALDFMERRYCVITEPPRPPIHTECVLDGGMGQGTVDVAVQRPDGKKYHLFGPLSETAGWELDGGPAEQTSSPLGEIPMCIRKMDRSVQICLEGKVGGDQSQGSKTVHEDFSQKLMGSVDSRLSRAGEGRAAQGSAPLSKQETATANPPWVGRWAYQNCSNKALTITLTKTHLDLSPFETECDVRQVRKTNSTFEITAACNGEDGRFTAVFNIAANARTLKFVRTHKFQLSPTDYVRCQ